MQKKEFIFLSKSDIDENMKKSVNEYLDLLDNKSKYFTANASILVGVGRSTNVNSSPQNLPPEYRLKPIADNYHNEMLMINFLNNFEDSSYTIKNSILVYNKNYIHEDIENLTAYAYTPTISYYDQNNKNLYSLNLGFTRIDKKDNENFKSSRY